LALKDMDVGVKLLGGLVGFAVLLALMSNGDPDNDAWGTGDQAGASESAEGADGADGADGLDPWSAGASDDASDLPTCDGVAPFATDAGTFLLPVHGPAVPFPSAGCQLGPGRPASDAVRVLQQALTACNGHPVTVDGAYGPETLAAVAAVQADHGVPTDGLYGPRTQVVMAWPADPGDAAAAGEDDTTTDPSSRCISHG
jgi:hypothetical protein